MSFTRGTFSVTRLPERTFAYIRHVGPYQGNTELFAKLFEQVGTWVEERGLMFDGHNAEAITIYHDDPSTTPPEENRISVGFTVPDASQGEGEIETMILKEGQFAVGTFEITADQYPDAWANLMRFIQGEKLHTGSLVYESYKNEPNEHSEGRHIVDICIEVV